MAKAKKRARPAASEELVEDAAPQAPPEENAARKKTMAQVARKYECHPRLAAP
jgi:hypothetical protein